MNKGFHAIIALVLGCKLSVLIESTKMNRMQGSLAVKGENWDWIGDRAPAVHLKHLHLGEMLAFFPILCLEWIVDLLLDWNLKICADFKGRAWRYLHNGVSTVVQWAIYGPLCEYL